MPSEYIYTLMFAVPQAKMVHASSHGSGHGYDYSCTDENDKKRLIIGCNLKFMRTTGYFKTTLKFFYEHVLHIIIKSFEWKQLIVL